MSFGSEPDSRKSVDGAASDADELPVASGDELTSACRAVAHFFDELPLCVPLVLGPRARRGSRSGPSAARLRARASGGLRRTRRGRWVGPRWSLRHRHRVGSGVLHHPELFLHVRALVHPRDRGPRDAVEQPLAWIALRHAADEDVQDEDDSEDLRQVPQEGMQDVQVPIDRHNAQGDQPLSDRRVEDRLQEHGVGEPDEAPVQSDQVPGPGQNREGDREDEPDREHDDRVDDKREEPTDPVLLQGRVVTNQVDRRGHVSPIQSRRYRTGLHKRAGIKYCRTIENQSGESAEASDGSSSSTRVDRRRYSPGISFDVKTVLPALWITTPASRAVFASISKMTGCAIRTRPASSAASNVALRWSISRPYRSGKCRKTPAIVRPRISTSSSLSRNLPSLPQCGQNSSRKKP